MTAWMRDLDIAGPAHAASFDGGVLAWRTECGAALGRVAAHEQGHGPRCGELGPRRDWYVPPRRAREDALTD